MSATVDGEVYKGSLAVNQSFGFGTGFSGGSVGFGNMMTMGNQARATLLSPTNKILRCDVAFTANAAQGVCQDPQGGTYDLVPK